MSSRACFYKGFSQQKWWVGQGLQCGFLGVQKSMRELEGEPKRIPTDQEALIWSALKTCHLNAVPCSPARAAVLRMTRHKAFSAMGAASKLGQMIEKLAENLPMKRRTNICRSRATPSGAGCQPHRDIKANSKVWRHLALLFWWPDCSWFRSKWVTQAKCFFGFGVTVLRYAALIIKKRTYTPLAKNLQVGEMTPLGHFFFDGQIVAGLDQSESHSQMFLRLWSDRAAMQRWSSKKNLHPACQKPTSRRNDATWPLLLWWPDCSWFCIKLNHKVKCFFGFGVTVLPCSVDHQKKNLHQVCQKPTSRRNDAT